MANFCLLVVYHHFWQGLCFVLLSMCVFALFTPSVVCTAEQLTGRPFCCYCNAISTVALQQGWRSPLTSTIGPKAPASAQGPPPPSGTWTQRWLGKGPGRNSCTCALQSWQSTWAWEKATPTTALRTCVTSSPPPACFLPWRLTCSIIQVGTMFLSFILHLIKKGRNV